MANLIRLIFCCALLVFTTGALSFSGRRREYNSDVTWMMLPDNEGKPQFALLRGPQSNPKAVNLTRDVHFILYTQSNPNDGYQLFVGDETGLKNSTFNQKNPTKIIVHGFTNDIDSPVIQDTKNAYLSESANNVIGVDWGELCKPPLYNLAKDHVIPVGKFVGELIDFLSSVGGQSPSRMHLIGHSLGAHVSGIAANNSKGTVSRITGLDTALPLFDDDPDSGRLDAKDAEFVDVIHTCGGWLGFMDTRGLVDFYPNGGISSQPGCGLDLTGSCSHGKAVEYFVTSIRNHSRYPANRCKTVDDAKDGKCDLESTSGYMGEGVSHSLRGIYFVATR